MPTYSDQTAGFTSNVNFLLQEKVYPDRYTTTTTATTPEPVGGGNNGGDADGSIENGLFAALGLPEWWWAPAAGFLLLMLVVWMG
eukprot:gene3226-7359_t